MLSSSQYEPEVAHCWLRMGNLKPSLTCCCCCCCEQVLTCRLLLLLVLLLRGCYRDSKASHHLQQLLLSCCLLLSCAQQLHWAWLQPLLQQQSSTADHVWLLQCFFLLQPWPLRLLLVLLLVLVRVLCGWLVLAVLAALLVM